MSLEHKDFPREFKCPKCGSDWRVVQTIVDEDKVLGRLGDNISDGVLEVRQVPVTDNSKSPKVGDESTGLIFFYDMCMECGTQYCYKIEDSTIRATLDVSRLINPYGTVGKGKQLPPGMRSN